MPTRGPFERRGDAVELFLTVTPGARREAIGAIADDGEGHRRLAVHVTAKADGGEANRAVVRLLAKSWRVAPTAFELTAGRRSRLKRVRLTVPPEKAQAIQALLA
ncbi:MAG: DUF167 domain-containing protein [Alphaproteobacteria bacterium]